MKPDIPYQMRHNGTVYELPFIADECKAVFVMTSANRLQGEAGQFLMNGKITGR